MKKTILNSTLGNHPENAVQRYDCFMVFTKQKSYLT